MRMRNSSPARPPASFHAVLRLPEDAAGRIAAGRTAVERAAMEQVEVRAVMARLAPRLEVLAAEGLLTRHTLFPTLGVVHIGVNPARIEEACRRLAVLPELADLTRDRVSQISFD